MSKIYILFCTSPLCAFRRLNINNCENNIHYITANGTRDLEMTPSHKQLDTEYVK